MDHKKFILFASLLFIGILYFGARPARAAVDLALTKIKVDPAEPAWNEPVTITATVVNNGDETIFDMAGLESVNLNFQDWNQTRLIMPQTAAGTSLAPAKSVTYTIEGYFFSEGQKNVGFGVDDANLLDEWKEGNNYDYIKVNVVSQNDLSVESIGVYPSSPAADQDCIITVTVKNKGFATVKSNYAANEYYYSFADFTEREKEEPEFGSDNPIRTGETYEYKFYGKFRTEGAKSLVFRIDKDDKLEEKDEENNEKSADVTVVSPTAIDLSVSSIELSKDSPLLGETVSITVKAKNTGKIMLMSDAGLRYDKNILVFPTIDEEVRYNFPDFKVESFKGGAYPAYGSPLQPGAEFSYTYTGKFFNNAGDRTLSFSVNTNERLHEKDKTNNTLTKTVRVYDTQAARDEFELGDIKAEFYSTSSAKISWHTSKSASSKLEYKRYDFTGWIDANSDTALEHSRTLTGLETNHAYDYRITATFGTISKEAKDLKFTTPKDDSVKVTAGPRYQAAGKDVTFTWTTDKLSDSLVFYRKQGATQWITASSKELVTAHSLSAAKLGDGDYEYYVRSAAQPGTVIESTAVPFSIGNAQQQEAATADTPTAAGQGDNSAGESDTGAVNAQTAAVTNREMYSRLKGKILLTVENNGEAYYVSPAREERFYLGRPDDAFTVMREQGVGITDDNLSRIPIGLAAVTGVDSDGDGLSDMFEDAIKTDKTKPDTDGDGYPDSQEVQNGYDPRGGNTITTDTSFGASQAGKIFLQVQSHGEAWYVNPADGKRYFLGRPGDAFAIMRTLGLGISNADFERL